MSNKIIDWNKKHKFKLKTELVKYSKTLKEVILDYKLDNEFIEKHSLDRMPYGRLHFKSDEFDLSVSVDEILAEDTKYNNTKAGEFKISLEKRIKANSIYGTLTLCLPVKEDTDRKELLKKAIDFLSEEIMEEVVSFETRDWHYKEIELSIIDAWMSGTEKFKETGNLKFDFEFKINDSEYLVQVSFNSRETMWASQPSSKYLAGALYATAYDLNDGENEEYGTLSYETWIEEDIDLDDYKNTTIYNGYLEQWAKPHDLIDELEYRLNKFIEWRKENERIKLL